MSFQEPSYWHRQALIEDRDSPHQIRLVFVGSSCSMLRVTCNCGAPIGDWLMPVNLPMIMDTYKQHLFDG
jgi:hypothetical protein